MRNKGGGGERKGSGDTAYPSADPGMSTILICGYYSSVRARVRPLQARHGCALQSVWERKRFEVLQGACWCGVSQPVRLVFRADRWFYTYCCASVLVQGSISSVQSLLFYSYQVCKHPANLEIDYLQTAKGSALCINCFSRKIPALKLL